MYPFKVLVGGKAKDLPYKEAAEAAASSFAWRLLTFSLGAPSAPGVPVPAAVYRNTELGITYKTVCEM
jgi:hypothetical protein